jgi:outer membrane protein OmpA-like peptidoglycan-associated protein
MTDVKKICARLGVVTMVALGASACSSIPDWVDPTTWVGGGDNSQTALPDPDADAQAGESPDLAAIPDRPAPGSTPAQQQQVASSLASDRADAKYSSDSLRGGTEPVAAPPPPPSAPEPQVKTVDAAPPPPAAAPSVAETAAPAPQANADINTANGDINTSPDAGTTAQAAPPPPPPAATQLPPAQPSPQIAATQMSSPPQPPQSGMPTMAQINPSDAALGFRPSSAPPLDPSIGQFVPQPIIARYDQTASNAGLSQPRIASNIASSVPVAPRHRSAKAMGGPEMSGSVVANLDAINAAPQNTTQASAYSNAQGLPPDSVVFFPGDGTLLGAEGRARVRAAVDAFKQRGGNGFIRIVGHSSSRTSNMPVEKHLEVIFNKSQDRANAVAKEVIAEGVPANRVLVEAVGDSQPVYYESMPKGEDGNRRAEIFLQS